MISPNSLSRKTESVLSRVNVSAINLSKTTASTRKTGKLSKDQLGGYFANMDRVAYLLIMIWNHTAQPQDIQEFKHHLIIDVIAPLEWFKEAKYINNPQFRDSVNGLIDIALAHTTKAKRLTKIKQAEMCGRSTKAYRNTWEPRLKFIELYLHLLFNQAGQQVHRNI